LRTPLTIFEEDPNNKREMHQYRGVCAVAFIKGTPNCRVLYKTMDGVRERYIAASKAVKDNAEKQLKEFGLIIKTNSGKIGLLVEPDEVYYTEKNVTFFYGDQEISFPTEQKTEKDIEELVQKIGG